MKSKDGEEGEHTSLLASSSAPQAVSTTTTSEQLPRMMDLSSSDNININNNNRLIGITGSISIEEMERGAKRLNSDNIDSDSVNSLLVLDNDEYYYGEDNESLSSSLHGSSSITAAADAVVGGGASAATLTRDDLEYLASQKQVSNSVFKHHEEEGQQTTQQSQQQSQQKLSSSSSSKKKWEFHKVETLSTEFAVFSYRGNSLVGRILWDETNTKNKKKPLKAIGVELKDKTIIEARYILSKS